MWEMHDQQQMIVTAGHQFKYAGIATADDRAPVDTIGDLVDARIVREARYASVPSQSSS